MTAKTQIRGMRVEDIDDILALEAASFPGIPPDRYWHPDMLRAHISVFPEGQFVAEREGRIVGSATSLRVPLATALSHHTWRQMTGNGYLTTHDPEGEALYGTEVMVHPDFRRLGIGKSLYAKRKELVRKLNMRALITGGRIPGYSKHAARHPPSDYVKAVIRGDLTDRTLSAQLKSGLTVAGVLQGYITDPSSLGNATLLVWWNLDYQPKG